MKNIHLELLQEVHAREILSWRYPPPYDFYNPPEIRATADYVSEFINPEYQFHAILDDDSRFIGFCSFGIDGQVSGGDYELEALDIGLGMKPELTGCGLGDLFLAAILNHAIKKFDPTIFRMTVANFNKRALRLYENFGFSKRGGFEDNILNIPYTILIKQL
jgi:RimJ/RimL family protein N-acetyltransferase